MTTREYVHRSVLPCPAERVFAWHARPGAFERLTPPFSPVRVLERTGRGIEPGARLVLRIPIGPAGITWVAEHRELEPGRSFRDVQVRGPFARWDHRHRFMPEGPGVSVLEDRIVWALPGGPIATALGEPLVRRMLDGMFAYRHRITAGDLASHAGCEEGRAASVLVSGASGFIGSALVPFLTTGGHRVVRLVRGAPPDPDAVAWDPSRGVLDASLPPDLDAVVHLAGEPIAAARWTEAVKARIRASRVDGTRLLCERLAALPRPPRVLVSASAIGIYGDRGDGSCDEDTAPGTGFLADVCRGWEDATAPARRAGIRVITLRIGVVLSPRGGALAQLLPLFRLGGGGVIGGGGQWTSWIGIDDVLGAIHHALVTETLSGPVNAVAPEPCTNRDFAATLACVLRRPAILPVPAAAVRLALGELADEAILASTRVAPGALLGSGYAFRTPGLEATLRHVLGR